MCVLTFEEYQYLLDIPLRADCQEAAVLAEIDLENEHHQAGVMAGVFQEIDLGKEHKKLGQMYPPCSLIKERRIE